jgi:hypothetical protein
MLKPATRSVSGKMDVAQRSLRVRFRGRCVLVTFASPYSVFPLPFLLPLFESTHLFLSARKKNLPFYAEAQGELPASSRLHVVHPFSVRVC